MPDAASGATAGHASAGTQVPARPPTSDQPATAGGLAIAAFALSILTLLKTLYGDWRASRTKAATKFETNYATPVRTGLRAYEKALRTLRVYNVPTAKSLEALKEEIATERGKWLDGADEMAHLLQEVEDACDLVQSGWAAAFRARADVAEAHMLAMTEDTAGTAADVAASAAAARAELDLAIVEVRANLRAEGESYERLGRRR